ncbi:isoprenylcysteine carboxylmethyltransferase family protein [uncultured Sulfitobacter sp.]|uniref:methyltransferase family protein n=1 Tax=uncultured Sulfitobacter sp. TaxID=191468 RepID=UPI00261B107D|nr:isoprenylcysteine carboxylmethyltransferase family protein [uncultured Sulfitobacter sp.]
MNIPPLAQLSFCMVMASLLASFAPLAAFHAPVWLIAFEAIAGVAFLLPAFVSFVRHKTTVNPQSPEAATTLVTSGIYSITRNPMYVGMLILLIAFVLWLGALSAVLAVIAFFLIIDRFQIRSEERVLIQLFDNPYQDYAARIPRWLFIRSKLDSSND